MSCRLDPALECRCGFLVFCIKIITNKLQLYKTVNSETKEPLVSVIMPCYKMGQFIGEALESVGKQTYTNWEVIAVDDCGPEDGTKEAVEDFAKKFPAHRIIYHRHEKNGGVSAARNTAIELAQGEYLAFLDPDDFYLPNKFECDLNVLEENPSVVLTHSAAIQQFLLETGLGNEQIGFQLFEKSKAYRLEETESFLLRNWICNSTVFVKRSLFESICFPEKMVFQYEDWVAWSLLAEMGVFYYQSNANTVYRLHNASASAEIIKNERKENFATLEALLCIRNHLEKSDAKFIADKNLLGQLIRIEKNCLENSPKKHEKTHYDCRLVNNLLFAILKIKFDIFLRKIPFLKMFSLKGFLGSRSQ